MIGKIGFSLIWTTPIAFLGYLTIYSHDNLPDSPFPILIGSATILVTFIFAIKIGTIWSK